MSVQEIWERWYQGTEVVIEDVEEVMAAAALDVKVSASLLRPTDDLGKDLGLEGWELDDLFELELWVSLAIRKARRRGRKEVQARSTRWMTRFGFRRGCGPEEAR